MTTGRLKRLWVLALSLFVLHPVFGQSYSLSIPIGWRSEHLTFPLDFARDITYVGYEELAFSPGMFDVNAPDYFSYAFVWVLNNQPVFDAEQLQEDLGFYFDGLMSQTALNKTLTRSGGNAIITLEETTTASWESTLLTGIYQGNIESYDAFSDGRELKLNCEILIFSLAEEKRSCIFFMLSPQPDDHNIWEVLKQIAIDFEAVLNAEHK